MAPEQPRSSLIVWQDRTSVDLGPGLSSLSGLVRVSSLG